MCYKKISMNTGRNHYNFLVFIFFWLLINTVWVDKHVVRNGYQTTGVHTQKIVCVYLINFSDISKDSQTRRLREVTRQTRTDACTHRVISPVRSSVNFFRLIITIFFKFNTSYAHIYTHTQTGKPVFSL